MVAGWPEVSSPVQGLTKEFVVWMTHNCGKCKKMKLSLSRPVKHRDSVFRWSGGNLETCDEIYFHGWNIKIKLLITHLISFGTTAVAVFRVISIKSILLIMIGAIRCCYGDCFSHRDVICMIAHPYFSIEHACCYTAQVSLWCNKHAYVAQRRRVLTQPRQK